MNILSKLLRKQLYILFFEDSKERIFYIQQILEKSRGIEKI
jgi:hypothetical protein